MRNLLIAMLMFCACACNGQALRLSQPTYDDTVLPDASTTVMLHFDDDFLDIGGNTWASLGVYPHTFGAAKYGSAAAMATIQAGAGWYSQLKSTNATAATTFETGDFTVEFWGKAELSPVYGFAYGSDITVGQVDILSTISPYKNASLKFGGYAAAQDIAGSGVPRFASFTPTISYSDTDSTATSASTIEEDSLNSPQWHHICFERRSGTIYGYINGNQLFSIACSFDISAVLQTTLLSDYTAGALAGYLFVDDFRIKKGGYVYGGAFTPPTRAIGLQKPFKLSFSDGKISF